MNWAEFFAGLTTCLVAVIPLVIKLVNAVRAERRGADAMSEALDSPEPKAALKKQTTLDSGLARHLDGVTERRKTTRLAEPEKKEKTE